MLPGAMDGGALCARLRAQKIRTPILGLTALDAVGDRVRGLDAGADHHLVKPFAFAELLARVRSVARRHLEDRSAQHGGLLLDTAARR
jgi:DNA-binding response OmpR family regulator